LYSSDGGYNFGKLVKTPVTLGVSREGKGGYTTGDLELLVVACYCSIRADTPSSKPYLSVVPPQCSDLNGAAPDANSQARSSLTGCVDADPSVGMMGVGFGRGGNPMDNAFLRLTAMDLGAMHSGYIIGEDSITLGLTGDKRTGRNRADASG
jgi:hypothetical protein